jgi:hypothetical protein
MVWFSDLHGTLLEIDKQPHGVFQMNSMQIQEMCHPPNNTKKGIKIQREQCKLFPSSK